MNVGALLGAVWLVVIVQLLFANWAGTALTLGDSDDAMRLVEVRALLDGRGWSTCTNLASPHRLDSIRTGRA